MRLLSSDFVKEVIPYPSDTRTKCSTLKEAIKMFASNDQNCISTCMFFLLLEKSIFQTHSSCVGQAPASILSSSPTLRQHQGPAASFVPPPITIRGFPGGSVVKNPSAHAGDTSSICGLEDLLEEEMAMHSCILAWRIPQTEEPGGLRAMGSLRAGHN